MMTADHHADRFPSLSDQAEPNERPDRRSQDRMPQVDWLTGISSRAAFARQVNQADLDRDQFAVAVLGIGHVDDINRHLGFQVGDDLLRLIGRVLSEHVGVGTTVARLGGARFGVMTVGWSTVDVAEWIEPVATAVDNVIAGWIFEQIDFHGTCLIEPALLVGAAGGYNGRVWADASIALDVAEADPAPDGQGATVVIHNQADARFAARRNAERLNEAVRAGLRHDTIRWTRRLIERCDSPDPHRPWFKIEARNPEGTEPIASTALRATVGAQLERSAVEQAADLLATNDGQLRVTIALCWLARTGRAVDSWLTPIIVGRRVPASRFVFEVAEADVIGHPANVASVCSALTDLGSELILTGCSGGVDTVQALDLITARYLAPNPDLVRRAEDGEPSAVRVLDGVLDLATDIGGDLLYTGRRPHHLDPQPAGSPRPGAGSSAGFWQQHPVPIDQVGD